MGEPNRITRDSDKEWPYSPKFQKFADFMGLPATKDSKGVNWRYDEKTAKRLEEIYLWGKEVADSEDPVDIMYAVNNLRKELGVNWKGKTLTDHLWGYIRLDIKDKLLDKTKMNIAKEKELYQNPPKPEEKNE